MTSVPKSTFVRRRMSPRDSTFSRATMICLMRGWSGATPYRTRPKGAGSRSMRSMPTPSNPVPDRSALERMSEA